MRTASIILWLALAPLAGGCGGHEFMVSAPAGLVQGVHEIDVGIDEYHSAALADFDSAADKSRAALQADLAAYLVKVVKANVPNVTEAQAAEQVARILTVYDAQVESLRAERANEAERYTRLKGLIQWTREVCAQMAEIETRRYDTLEQLKEKAATYTRLKLSGRSEP